MAGDIKLNNEGVEVVGILNAGEITPVSRQLKVNSWDLCLDSNDRRKPDSGPGPVVVNPTHSPSPMRRALVHDVGDKLTINYARDYPGGVDIQGSVNIDTLNIGTSLMARATKLLGVSWYGGPKTILCFAQDLVLADKDKDPEEPLKNVALSHLPGDKLVVNRGKGYKGGVEIQGAVTLPEKLTVQGMNVVAEIEALKDEIKALKAKLA